MPVYQIIMANFIYFAILADNNELKYTIFMVELCFASIGVCTPHLVKLKYTQAHKNIVRFME
jgi:hypothetical protein